MTIRRLALAEGAAGASGLVLLIDVFRAFTVAPLLLRRGASRVRLRGEADALGRDRDNRVWLGSDPGGAPAEESFPDSPWWLSRLDPVGLVGRPVSLAAPVAARAVAAALAAPAGEVLVAAFVNAAATAAYVRARTPAEVSLVAIGEDGTRRAPEDEFCADYLTHLLTGSPYDHALAVAGAVGHACGQRFFQGDPAMPPQDPVLCLQRDVIDVVARAERGADGLALVAVTPADAGGQRPGQANADRVTG